jgi:hypothetical protein
VQVTPRAFNFIQQIFKISNMLNLFMLKSKVQVGNNADKECIRFFKEVKPIATLRFKSNFERNRKMPSTDESELRAVLNLLRVACKDCELNFYSVAPAIRRQRTGSQGEN